MITTIYIVIIRQGNEPEKLRGIKMEANIYEIINGTNNEILLRTEHAADYETEEEFRERVNDMYSVDDGAIRIEFCA